MPFLTTHPSSPCFRMELTTGNVDMHFANVTIEVNSAGHDIFQRVFNGIKRYQDTKMPTANTPWHIIP